jgi:hypothetical protein
VLLTVLALSACATNSKPPLPPVVGQGITLTPLPASVTQLDSTNSDDWRAKVSNYLKKVEAFSTSVKQN